MLSAEEYPDKKALAKAIEDRIHGRRGFVYVAASSCILVEGDIVHISLDMDLPEDIKILTAKMYVMHKTPGHSDWNKAKAILKNAGITAA